MGCTSSTRMCFSSEYPISLLPECKQEPRDAVAMGYITQPNLALTSTAVMSSGLQWLAPRRKRPWLGYDEITSRSGGSVGHRRPQELQIIPSHKDDLTAQPQKWYPECKPFLLTPPSYLVSFLPANKIQYSEVILTARLQPTASSFRIHNQYRVIHSRFLSSSAGPLSEDCFF